MQSFIKFSVSLSIVIFSLFLVSMITYAQEPMSDIDTEEVVTDADTETTVDEENEEDKMDQEENGETVEGIFRLNKDESKKIRYNGEKITVYACEVFVDLNNDEKTTTADARILLRIVAKIEKFNEDISLCDMTNDGSLSSNDARLLLRYSAKLDKYFSNEDQIRITGFVKDEKGIEYCFSEYGYLENGYVKINNNYYYLNQGIKRTGLIDGPDSVYYMDRNGKGINGFKTISGNRYYFENGKGVHGFKTIFGNLYYFENGQAQKGFVTIGNDIYYFGSDYKAAKGTVKINGSEYSFSDSHKLLDGFIEKDNKTYLYSNGKLYTGWYFDDLDVYYFNKDGSMAKNTKIGDVSFDSKGLASTTKINESTLPVYIRSILKQIGTSPESIYNYVHYNYRYKLYAKSSPDAMVVRMLTNRRGACYDYAYLTKYLLEAAGYECRIVVGASFTPTGTEHDWVLVKVNGAWRHMDTQKGAYLKTDSQLRNLGYRWSAQGLPAAV